MDRQDERDVRQNAREAVQSKGIVLQPWLVSLMISVAIQFIGLAFFTGTIVTRIDALDARVQRIERQLDEDRRQRAASVIVER